MGRTKPRKSAHPGAATPSGKLTQPAGMQHMGEDLYQLIRQAIHEQALVATPAPPGS